MKILAFSTRDSQVMQAFFALPRQVYTGDPAWVPQSEAAVANLLRQNGDQSDELAGLAFVQPLLAVDEASGAPLARAIAILHPGARDEIGRRLGYIGGFECLADHEAAGRAVLEQAEGLLRAQGAATIQAPRIDNMQMGLVIEGHHLPQTVGTPHNPPYYAAILQALGYQVREELYTYIFDRSCAIQLPFRVPGIQTRTFDRAYLEREVSIFHHLQQAIFQSHPGWLPRTLAEDRQMIEGYLPVLDDELVIIAEDRAGQAMGLLVCLPDVDQAMRGQAVDNARLISIGALPAVAHKGVGVMMGLHLMRNLLAKGYQTLEGSWVRDSNIAPQNLARRFKGRRGRVFAVFEKG